MAGFSEGLFRDITFRIPPEERYPLQKLTTFQIQATADYLVRVSEIRELRQTLLELDRQDLPWLILGKGSNTLFSDGGFKGAILQLEGDFKRVIRGNQDTLNVGAGVANSSLAAKARQEGWGGLEFLVSIPGTIGGGICMNAGAHGKEFADCLIRIEIMNAYGETQILNKDALELKYRESNLSQKKHIALYAQLSCKATQPEAVKRLQNQWILHRRQNQPVKSRNWGSVFRNPSGTKTAGQLIEACELKGKGFGDAIISPKHANFIENQGQATFSDTLATILLAKKSVQERFGVTLVPEVKIYAENGSLLKI